MDITLLLLSLCVAGLFAGTLLVARFPGTGSSAFLSLMAGGVTFLAIGIFAELLLALVVPSGLQGSGRTAAVVIIPGLGIVAGLLVARSIWRKIRSIQPNVDN